MFCKNCGNQLNDEAVVCPHCGVQVGKVKSASNDGNDIALVGLILFFLGMCVIGLVCSVIGYKQTVKSGSENKGVAVAGIVLNSLLLGACVIGIGIFILIVTFGVTMYHMPNTGR